MPGLEGAVECLLAQVHEERQEWVERLEGLQQYTAKALPAWVVADLLAAAKGREQEAWRALVEVRTGV